MLHSEPCRREALSKRFTILIHQGYTRVKLNDKVDRIDKVKEESFLDEENELSVLIDRFVTNSKEEDSRVAEAIRTALTEGNNRCSIQIEEETTEFSTEFEADGMRFEEPSVHFFSFNNPYGACKRCEGFGNIIGIDEDLVMPDKELSIFEEGIVCWRGDSMSMYKDQLVHSASKFDFPIHRPIYDLTEEQNQLLWEGNKHFEGLHAFFRMLEENSYKIQYRVMLSRYRGKNTMSGM